MADNAHLHISAMGVLQTSLRLLAGEMPTVKVAFRTDASLNIGTGHVMRCLTLADALRESGADCVFLSRNHAGHLHQVVETRGYPILSLGGANPEFSQVTEGGYEHWLGVDFQDDADHTRARLENMSIDWLVVDHYGLDARWETLLRPCCGRIMAIDDLANRDHNVDILLDQNLGKTPADYKAKVPTSCMMMLGPNYALLRPEFAALRAASLSKRNKGRLRKILITMGGVDSENATGEVLGALKEWRASAGLEVTVVMGLNAPWQHQLRKKARHMPFPTEVLVNVRQMETLMCDAELSIGAAGTTSWERCCLGLPALQFALAENQRPTAHALSQAGAAFQLEIDALGESLHRTMDQLVSDPALLVHMSGAAAQITDGRGTARVAKLLIDGNTDNLSESLLA